MLYDLQGKYNPLINGGEFQSGCIPKIFAESEARNPTIEFMAWQAIEGTSQTLRSFNVQIDDLLKQMSKRGFFKTWKVDEATAKDWLEGTDKTHLYEAGFRIGSEDITIPYASNSKNIRDAFHETFLSVVGRTASEKDRLRFFRVEREVVEARSKIFDLQIDLRKFRKDFGEIDRDTGDFWETKNPRKHDKVSANLTNAEQKAKEVEELFNQLVNALHELEPVVENYSVFLQRAGWRSRLFISDLKKLECGELSVVKVKNFTITGAIFWGSFLIAVIALIAAISLLGGPFGIIVGALAVCGIALGLCIASSITYGFKSYDRAAKLAKWYDETIPDLEKLAKNLEDVKPILQAAISDFEPQKVAILKEIEHELGDGIEGRSEADLAKELGRLAYYHDVVEKAEAEVYEVEVKRPPEGLTNAVSSALRSAGYDKVTGPQSSRRHKERLMEKIKFSASFRRKVVLGGSATLFERDSLNEHAWMAARELNESETRAIALATIIHHVESPAALEELLTENRDFWRAMKVVDLSDDDCDDLRAAIDESNVRPVSAS